MESSNQMRKQGHTQNRLFFLKTGIGLHKESLKYILQSMFQFRLPLNKNIVIPNKEIFWKKLISMKKDGGNFLQVLDYEIEYDV